MSLIFNFSSFPTVDTDRLTLRQFNDEDSTLLNELFSYPEVLEFSNRPPMNSEEEAKKLIDLFNEGFNNKKRIQWAITLTDQDQFIGTCGVYAWDTENRRADIGYNLIPQYWGNGYATEASHAMIRWCFHNLDLNRLQADCTDGHIASEKVLLKCGFKVEGVWREQYWEYGKFVNIKQFGLLRREYELS